MIENDSGILRITDGATEVYNSATDKLLHLIPPRIDGSVSRSGLNYGGSSTWNTRSADFSVATLPAVATDIVGLVRVTYGSGDRSYLPNDAWHPAGGSLILEFKTFQTITGTWGNYMANFGSATIYKDGTDLRFREELALKDHRLNSLGFSLAAYTLHYRIYPAVFS